MALLTSSLTFQVDQSFPISSVVAKFQMASRKWDAYLTLNLTSRQSSTKTCAGSNRFDKRCRWDIPLEDLSKIRGILDIMEMTSPRDAVVFLQELAPLSLCKDYHQSQFPELISGWMLVMNDAIRKYQEEESLKNRVLFLEQQLQNLHAIDQLRLQQLEEFEKWKAALQSSVEQEDQLRKLLNGSNAEVSRLAALLNQERTTFSQQLSAERDRLAEYKNRVDAHCANQDKAIADLRSKLDQEYQRSDGQSESLQKLEIVKSNLLAEIESLKAVLAKECVKLDHQSKEANDILRDSRGLLEQTKSVQGQLSHFQEQSQKFKDELEAANTGQATLLQELEDSQSQLAVERDDNAELRLNLETAEENWAHAQDSWEQSKSETQELHRLELARVHEALNLVTVELESSNATNGEQATELENIQNVLKRTQLNFQQVEAEKATVTQQLETTQSQLRVAQRNSKELQKSDETHTSELAKVQKTLAQTVLELQTSGTVTSEQTSQLERIQDTLQRTQLHLQKIEKSRNFLISQYLNAEVALAQTQAELAASLNSNKTRKKVAAALAKVNADEVAVLLDRIDKLEEQLPRSFLGLSMQKMRMLMVGVWLWMLTPRLD